MLPGGALVPTPDLPALIKESNAEERKRRRLLANCRSAKESRQRRRGLLMKLSNELEKLILEKRSMSETNMQLRAQTQVLKQQLMLVRTVNAVSHHHYLQQQQKQVLLKTAQQQQQQQLQQQVLMQTVQEQQQTVRKVFHKEKILVASPSDNCDMRMTRVEDQAEIVPTSRYMCAAAGRESLATSDSHLESSDILSEECKNALLKIAFDTW